MNDKEMPKSQPATQVVTTSCPIEHGEFKVSVSEAEAYFEKYGLYMINGGLKKTTPSESDHQSDADDTPDISV